MKERQRRIKKEFRKIAEEEGVSDRQVTLVEDSMWKFVADRIRATNRETEEHSNIYLRFLGTIFVAPFRIRKIKENIKKHE